MAWGKWIIRFGLWIWSCVNVGVNGGRGCITAVWGAIVLRRLDLPRVGYIHSGYSSQASFYLWCFPIYSKISLFRCFFLDVECVFYGERKYNFRCLYCDSIINNYIKSLSLDSCSIPAMMKASIDWGSRRCQFRQYLGFIFSSQLHRPIFIVAAFFFQNLFKISRHYWVWVKRITICNWLFFFFSFFW